MSRKSPSRGKAPSRASAADESLAAANRFRGTARAPSRAHLWWLGILVIAVTAAAFLPVLANGWVERDDTANFLENPGYRGVGWAQIRWAFCTFYLGVYQPVAWVLLGAQYELCGLMPWGYHLASLALHCANAVVLMALAAAISKRSGHLPATGAVEARARNLGAAAAATLFAVHPLRVEVVAWASCQPYLPCALFAMLTVLAYLRRDGAGAAGRVGWLALAWMFYVGSLLCKAASLTLPVALLVLDAFPLNRFSGRGHSRPATILYALLEKLPFAFVGVVFIALALAGRYVVDPAFVSEDSLGIGRRLIRACYTAGFYVEKSVWPSKLSGIYEWPDEASLADTWFAVAALGAVGMTLIATALARRWKGAAALWLVYLILLAPVSGFVRSGYSVVADRYAYIATIPFFIGLSYLLAKAWAAVGERSRVALGLNLALIGATLGLSVSSWKLIRTWHDYDALIARAAAAGTLSRPTYSMELGMRRERDRQFSEAELLFREAVQLAPDRADAANSLGSFLSRRGRPAEALGWFERSVEIDPRFAVGYNNAGLALAEKGQVNEAAQRFEKALGVQPNFVEARLNLASLFRRQRQWDAAAEQYALVLRTDPENRRARSGLEAVAAETRQPGLP